MKKISVLFLLITTMFAIIFLQNFNKKSYADNINKIEVKAKSAYLIDENLTTTMFSKNEEERLPIASMTKIMTLLITFEKIKDNVISFNDEIEVSKNAMSMGGSQVFLDCKNKYKISDLIKSIVIASANDSCVAIAEKVSGSELSFVNEMNKKAKELELNNTNFENCTGLPKINHYSCAKDVAKMFSELIKNKEYFNFSKIWLDKFYHNQNDFTEITNTNKLIKYYDGCDGGKTGYTSEAGFCICATALRNNMRLISVVINEPDSKTRFFDSSKMFNYGFSEYKNKEIYSCNKPLDFSINIKKSNTTTNKVCLMSPINVVEKNNEKNNYTYTYKINDNLIAPIKRGESVGYLTIYKNGIEIQTCNLVSYNNIEKKTLKDNINCIVSNWYI